MGVVESLGMSVAAPLCGRPPRGAAAAGACEIALVPGPPHIAPTGLRRYPPDSPQAAARIVALALMSNGRIKSVEAATLDAVEAHALLGLARNEWYAVLGHLRLDLLHVQHSRGFSIPGPALERVLNDGTNEDLQRVVAALSVAVIHADRRVASGEQAFLAALQRKWNVPVHPEPCGLLLRQRVLMRKSSQGETLEHLSDRPYDECRPEHLCES